MDTKVNDDKSIISPFYIGPNSVPFNKPLKFSINIFNNQDVDHFVLSSYDSKNNEWTPLNTKRSDSKIISAEIQKGETIGVLIDLLLVKVRVIIFPTLASELFELFETNVTGSKCGRVASTATPAKSTLFQNAAFV